jgi:hypothetical protein
MMVEPTDRFDRLLRAEWYTPEQLADLFEVTANTIRTAVFENQLHARVIDGHILEINRDSALDWLKIRLRQEQAWQR